VSFSVQSVTYQRRACGSLSLCIPLQLQGNGSVNTFQRLRKIVRGVIFYTVRVLSKKSERLVLTTTSRYFFNAILLGNVVILFDNVTAYHREDFIAFSRCEICMSFRTTSHLQCGTSDTRLYSNNKQYYIIFTEGP
jgi:hypothetical protein